MCRLPNEMIDERFRKKQLHGLLTWSLVCQCRCLLKIWGCNV